MVVTAERSPVGDQLSDGRIRRCQSLTSAKPAEAAARIAEAKRKRDDQFAPDRARTQEGGEGSERGEEATR